MKQLSTVSNILRLGKKTNTKNKKNQTNPDQSGGNRRNCTAMQNWERTGKYLFIKKRREKKSCGETGKEQMQGKYNLK